MNNSLIVLPKQKIKIISFTLAFTALAILLPMITHQLAGNQAGRLFLPMHLFIFVSALLFGWRSGITTGILAPLISFSITGMPAIAILPIITAELAFYGILAGYFHKTMGWNVFSSLLGTMVLGRLALMLFIAITPIKISATNFVFSAMKAGLIGIAIQLILIPLIYAALKKYIADEKL